MKHYRMTALLTALFLLCTPAFESIESCAAPRIPRKTVTVSEVQPQPEKPDPEKPGPEKPGPEIPDIDSGLLTVQNERTGEIVTGPAYDILCQIVEAEIGSLETEAIKAQAVATHTYMLYNMQRGDVPRCVLKTPTQRVKDAVAAVSQEVLLYDGELALAVYCASSGGGTQASKDYWGGDLPYLQAADCPYDKNAYSRTLDVEYVRKWFPESVFPEDPKEWFEILTTNENGFVLTIRAGDQILSGYDFCSTKHIWLRSNKITSIDYNPADHTFTFHVLGNGHGVGLSQIGAIGYAKHEGRDYKWILSHFYAGTTIQNLRENN